MRGASDKRDIEALWACYEPLRRAGHREADAGNLDAQGASAKQGWCYNRLRQCFVDLHRLIECIDYFLVYVELHRYEPFYVFLHKCWLFYITLCRSMEMLLPAHHRTTTTTPPFLCTPAATNQWPRSPLSACDCSRGPGPLLLLLLLLLVATAAAAAGHHCCHRHWLPLLLPLLVATTAATTVVIAGGERGKGRGRREGGKRGRWGRERRGRSAATTLTIAL